MLNQLYVLWKTVKNHIYITFAGKESRNKIIFMVFACIVFFTAQIYYEHKFNNELAKAAKIDPGTLDFPYKNNEIKDKYKVVFITSDGGEYSYAEYFKYAAEKMGWEVKIYYNNAWTHENEILDLDPDFFLFCLYSEANLSSKLKAHRSKKYLLNFTSFQRMRNEVDAKISKIDPYKPLDSLKKYIDSVHGVLAFTKDMAIYRTMFENINKPFNGIGLLPSVPDEHYNTIAPPKNLMWPSCDGGGLRATKKYKHFIKLLSENVSMKVYGSNNATSYLAPGVYDGMISPGMDNITTIRKNGIYLLTHGDWHFTNNEFSMRGFEAAAAGAVVISDKLPFIVEHFGDSFLYFDHNADAQTMYEQVKTHVEWIKANPEKAQVMAEKANKIYREKFTLREDLIRIAKMHEGVLAQEKAMGLSHPLAY